jgi:hypothetical protein
LVVLLLVFASRYASKQSNSESTGAPNHMGKARPRLVRVDLWRCYLNL